MDNNSFKALHRRGQARVQLGYLTEACEDFRRAMDLVHVNKDENQNSNKIEKIIAEINTDLLKARSKLQSQSRQGEGGDVVVSSTSHKGGKVIIEELETRAEGPWRKVQVQSDDDDDSD